MTDEEKKELEALRAEKHSREQAERARAALTTAGMSVGFAALLIGTDDADTDRRVQNFCAAYQESLAEDIKKRLGRSTDKFDALANTFYPIVIKRPVDKKRIAQAVY